MEGVLWVQRCMAMGARKMTRQLIEKNTFDMSIGLFMSISPSTIRYL
jgi:hypothetical protein